MKYTYTMDGGASGNSGVALLSGSGILVGDRITLVSGARQWRIRIPSTKESEGNVLLVEYRSGAKWIVGIQWDIPIISSA